MPVGTFGCTHWFEFSGGKCLRCSSQAGVEWRAYPYIWGPQMFRQCDRQPPHHQRSRGCRSLGWTHQWCHEWRRRPRGQSLAPMSLHIDLEKRTCRGPVCASCNHSYPMAIIISISPNNIIRNGGMPPPNGCNMPGVPPKNANGVCHSNIAPMCPNPLQRGCNCSIQQILETPQCLQKPIGKGL